MLRWRRDPAFRRFLVPDPPNVDGFTRWVADSASIEPWTLRGIVFEGRLIGYCCIDDLNPTIGKAQVGILIGDTDCWGRGIGTRVMSMLIDHCFDNLDLHRLLAVIARGNERSIGLFESLGFMHEGTLRDGTLVEGARADLLCYSLLRPEYEGDRDRSDN